MKKLLTILFGALVALSLFVTTGNTAKAAEECGCPTPVYGAEKHKLVADLLSNEKFKSAKQYLTTAGFSFKGVSLVQVGSLENIPVVAVPFYSTEGKVIVAGFVNGAFAGLMDPETEQPIPLP